MIQVKFSQSKEHLCWKSQIYTDATPIEAIALHGTKQPLKYIKAFFGSWWKILECHVGCFMRCWKEYLDTNKKTNYITRRKTRRIY
jgi:hypothetical protein